MLSHRKGVLLDGIGSELVRSSAGGRRKTLSSWLGAAGDMTVTATGGDTLTLAEWFKWQARGTDAPSSNYGYFSDRATNGDTAFPLKMRHQLALGAGADEDFNTTGGQTWLSTSFDHYFARSATLLSISPMGGAGGVFATRRSDAYDGNAVWTTGEAVTIGAVRGYVNSNGSQSLYTATTSGTTGATPPTHTTGSVSDGTVTWSFTQLQYRTAMGFASLAYNNAADGGPAWGGYIEAYRAAGAGYTHGLEVDIKNGGSNVQVHPYSISTAGATDALNLAAGPTQYGPSASNPVSAAIIFQSNGSTTFNKGLVFESTSLTDEGGGVYLPLNLFVGCHIRQYASDGTTGSSIQFNGTANNERVALSLQNRAIYALCQGAIMGGFESIPSAGSTPDNYVVISAHAAADGYVQIRPAGTTTDLKLSLRSKGAEDVHILREDSSTNTVPHVLSVKRRSTGTPATGIGAALTFDVETAAGNDEIGAIIEAVTTDVTSTSEDFDLVLKTMAAGATAAERARLNDKGLFLNTGSASVWRTIGSGVVAARSSVNAAGDATETAQATVTIPANALGAKGVIKVTILCEQTNSANAKTWRVRFGGISGTQYYSLAATSNALLQTQVIIRNNNATNSQVGYANANAAPFGQTTNAKTTGAIDTTSAQDLVISNFWAGATSGETMQLLHYQVEVFYQA